MKIRIGTSIAAFVFGMQVASAADTVFVQKASPVAVQQASSPWQLRVRALGVIPRNKGHVNGVAYSGLEFSDTVVPELDITYYFTDNFAAELILGTTYSHIGGSGSLGGIGKVGKTWLLPPTLTAQYHFTNFGKLKPYIGAGVNYTIFYKEEGNSHPWGQNRVSGLDIANTWGAAAQAGFDYMFDQHWGFNADIKKLYLRPDFDARLDGAHIKGKAKLDPWLIGAGITYRF